MVSYTRFMARGARGPKTPEEALSRALSKTLRHAAKSQGFSQDENGWCVIGELLAKPPYTTLDATPERVYAVVASDKKGRYELSQDKQKIRAVQGHSVDVDVGLTPIVQESDLPSVIVHGTTPEAWEKIKDSGLHKMGRQHIHMATGLFGEPGVRSGMRASSKVHIYIDGPAALRDGIQFYQAANGAILSPGIDGTIPTAYFKRVSNANLDPLA